MHYRKRLLAVFLAVFLSMKAEPSMSQPEVKSYIPPSPNAMTFMKYGDYPVDFSTGVPGISIPLYNIDLKGFSFPISASFHASGRTTSLNFSSLGLNWALNASGMISREVKGKVDVESYSNHPEQPASYYSPQVSHRDELVAMENPTRQGSTSSTDTEYDIYSISINGLSAKFIIRNNGSVVFLTYCPYSVTGGPGSGFTVTDDKGSVYKFGNEAGGYGMTEMASNIGNTSWCISSITTFSGCILHFKYGSLTPTDQAQKGIGSWSYTDQATIGDWPNSYNFNNIPAFTNQVSTLKKTNSNYAETYYMTYLQEISFDNGKVTFTYNNANMLLQECKVISQPENKVVRDVFFDYYTSLPGTTNRLANNNSTTIQDIRFTDANAANIEKYHFDYYEAASNDPDQFAFCTGKDYWGYCNGQYNTTPGSNGIPISSVNISSPPNNYYSQSLGGGPERRAAFLSYKLPGMIKKIYYPTGGYTEFKYEANKFNNDGIATDGPGIRLQQQISDDGQGNKITKDYRYGENEDGLGVLLWKPAKEDYTTLKVRNFLDIMPGTSISYPYNYSFYRWRVYSSEPCPDLQQAIHQPIYYSRVTEYNSTTTTLGQNGRTIYTYNVPTFSKPYASMSANESYYTQSFIFDNWSTSQISSKTIQKNVGGATPYKTISQTNYNYLTHNDVNIPQTIVYRMHEFADDDPNYSYYKELAYMNNPPPYGYGLGEPSRDVFYLVNKPIKSGIMKLSSETTTQFDDAGGTVVTTTSNSYQSNYQLRPYKVSVDKSNGRLSNTYFNYFADLPTRTIQTESASDGSNAFVTGGNSISYYKYGMVSSTTRLDIPAPVSFSAVDASGFPPVAAGDFKPRVAIVYDANNNPQKATPQDNSSTSYLWDYRKMYPIAEATNATADQIAYTSFEADGTGNWSYTGTVSTASSTALPPTGAKYYNLTASTPLSKSVTNGQVYTLAYWRDNTSAYSITGATVNSTYTGQTCNGWTYFKHQVTATSSTISITGTGGLDEARLHPVVARMTTLTYDPLIGMTSQSGADGKITYFEYDAAGRLSVVRDQERNILKRICYNYAGQVSECSINATASWTATGNLRCATYNGSNTGFQEREEKDTNPYSATYNQTQWVTNGYNATACPMPATPSSFSAGTGFGIPTSSISLSGSTVSFYIVFYPYSSMTAGNSYLVANISGSCKPTTTRTLSYSSGGRNWTITIYPGGQMYWYLQSGSPSLPANGYVSTTTLSYNL